MENGGHREPDPKILKKLRVILSLKVLVSITTMSTKAFVLAAAVAATASAFAPSTGFKVMLLDLALNNALWNRSF